MSIVIPSAGLCEQLEQLMVEGDLLEVTVDEKKMLRGLLMKFHPNYRGELFFFSVSSFFSKFVLKLLPMQCFEIVLNVVFSGGSNCAM